MCLFVIINNNKFDVLIIINCEKVCIVIILVYYFCFMYFIIRFDCMECEKYRYMECKIWVGMGELFVLIFEKNNLKRYI